MSVRDEFVFFSDQWKTFGLRPLITTYPMLKGVAVGSAVTAIVHSGLSPFAQGLIIALVSAAIGALGMVIAAIIAARASLRVLDEQAKAEQHLADVKAALGVDKRHTDKEPHEHSS